MNYNFDRGLRCIGFIQSIVLYVQYTLLKFDIVIFNHIYTNNSIIINSINDCIMYDASYLSKGFIKPILIYVFLLAQYIASHLYLSDFIVIQ